MIFPEDLPCMLEYRLAYAVIITLPRRPVSTISSSGITDANIVHPQIPYGCLGWRRVDETEWHSLDTLPAHWLPFLNRARPSEMDPRPAPRR